MWSEGPGIVAHYVNCIPMTAQGRNIFDLAGNPQAIEGQDYEFYCPINLDNEGKVNKNRPDYFEVMKKCQLPIAMEADSASDEDDDRHDDGLNGGCKTTQTLEQQFSGTLPGRL